MDEGSSHGIVRFDVWKFLRNSNAKKAKCKHCLKELKYQSAMVGTGWANSCPGCMDRLRKCFLLAVIRSNPLHYNAAIVSFLFLKKDVQIPEAVPAFQKWSGHCK